MKKTLILLAAWLAVGTVLAQDKPAETDQQKAMAAYMKVGAVNENHEFLKKYVGEPKEGEKPWYVKYDVDFGLRDWYDKLSDKQHGTVNIIAIDKKSNICSGVSTSGTAFKFPGRLGDSPIIGAGNFCDNRFGAATCTGRGELAIRLGLARTIVSYMENGLSVREACFRGMKDINELNEKGGMNCLVMDKNGNTMSASTSRDSIYWYMDVDSKEPEQRQGIWVKE